MGPREIAHAVQVGALRRVRRGWYATQDAPPTLVAAARAGGRLTCLEALRLHGAWVLPSRDVHVRVASGVAVSRGPGLRIHWTAARVGPGLDPIECALSQAVGCADLRALVVAADSLVQRRLLTRNVLEQVLRESPRGRRILKLVDPRAESGIETVVRLALHRRGIRSKPQVVVAEVGRVDFLVGERLVLEVDGFEWHGDRVAFERDRARDRELVRRGYAVMRVTYRQALGEIDAVASDVAELVQRREHRWTGSRRAQLSESCDPLDPQTSTTLNPES